MRTAIDWKLVDQSMGKKVPLVLRTLRDQGIDVTALHSHMLSDSPHLFFLHFWASANSLSLAKGLRAALDRINSGRGAIEEQGYTFRKRTASGSFPCRWS